MSLLEYQRALGFILTDRKFRAAFFAGDEQAGSRFDLTERERESLLAMRRDRVMLHSHLLAHGRLELGFMAFPLTAEIVHRSTGDEAEDFCEAFPPLPEARGTLLVEADRVYAYFHPRLEAGEIAHPWVADLMRFEYTQVQLGADLDAWHSSVVAGEPGDDTLDPRSGYPYCGQHVRLLEFTYPVYDVMTRLEDGERIDTLDRLPEPAQVLMFKTPGSPWVRSYRVNRATADLVRACDGTRTVTDVLTELRHTYGSGVERGALAALDKLRAEGLAILLPQHRQPQAPAAGQSQS
ncbi:MAG: PqqD family protein [Rhodococcus sp.]|nr:PqqD family protein [Rhodococcus sp. (in: high G+C Gram-positive bacteria)]